MILTWCILRIFLRLLNIFCERCSFHVTSRTSSSSHTRNICWCRLVIIHLWFFKMLKPFRYLLLFFLTWCYRILVIKCQESWPNWLHNWTFRNISNSMISILIYNISPCPLRGPHVSHICFFHWHSFSHTILITKFTHWGCNSLSTVMFCLKLVSSHSSIIKIVIFKVVLFWWFTILWILNWFTIWPN